MLPPGVILLRKGRFYKSRFASAYRFVQNYLVTIRNVDGANKYNFGISYSSCIVRPPKYSSELSVQGSISTNGRGQEKKLATRVGVPVYNRPLNIAKLNSG